MRPLWNLLVIVALLHLGCGVTLGSVDNVCATRAASTLSSTPSRCGQPPTGNVVLESPSPAKANGQLSTSRLRLQPRQVRDTLPPDYRLYDRPKPWRWWQFWKRIRWTPAYHSSARPGKTRAAFPLWQNIEPLDPSHQRRLPRVFQNRKLNPPGIPRGTLKVMKWVELPLEFKQFAIARELQFAAYEIINRREPITSNQEWAEYYRQRAVFIYGEQERLFSKDVIREAGRLAARRAEELGGAVRNFGYRDTHRFLPHDWTIATDIEHEGSVLEAKLRPIFQKYSQTRLRVNLPPRLATPDGLQRPELGSGLETPPYLDDPPEAILEGIEFKPTKELGGNVLLAPNDQRIRAGRALNLPSLAEADFVPHDGQLMPENPVLLQSGDVLKEQMFLSHLPQFPAPPKAVQTVLRLMHWSELTDILQDLAIGTQMNIRAIYSLNEMWRYNKIYAPIQMNYANVVNLLSNRQSRNFNQAVREIADIKAAKLIEDLGVDLHRPLVRRIGTFFKTTPDMDFGTLKVLKAVESLNNDAFQRAAGNVWDFAVPERLKSVAPPELTGVMATGLEHGRKTVESAPEPLHGMTTESRPHPLPGMTAESPPESIYAPKTPPQSPKGDVIPMTPPKSLQDRPAVGNSGDPAAPLGHQFDGTSESKLFQNPSNLISSNVPSERKIFAKSSAYKGSSSTIFMENIRPNLRHVPEGWKARPWSPLSMNLPPWVERKDRHQSLETPDSPRQYSSSWSDVEISAAAPSKKGKSLPKKWKNPNGKPGMPSVQQAPKKFPDLLKPKSWMPELKMPKTDFGLKRVAAASSKKIAYTIGVKLTAQITHSLQRSLGNAAAKFGTKIVAKATIGFATTRMFASVVFKVLDFLNPVFIIADIIQTPFMIADMVINAVPHAFGKCDISKNICILEKNLNSYGCSSHHPCEVDGAVCGHRTISPHKTVCNWEKFVFWTKMTGMTSMQQMWREHSATVNQKRARHDIANLEKSRRDFAMCTRRSQCRKLEKAINHYKKKLDRHIAWSDMYTKPSWAKKAKRLWYQAEEWAKHHVIYWEKKVDKWERKVKEKEEKRHGKKPNWRLRKAKKMLEHRQKKLKISIEKLKKKIAKAEKYTIKADPFGMVTDWTDTTTMTEAQRMEFIRSPTTQKAATQKADTQTTDTQKANIQ